VDFSELRNAFVQDAEQEPERRGVIDRILRYEQEARDEARGTQALLHYWSWHRSQYLHALPWSKQLYYWTIYRAERTLAIVGLVGASYAARRPLLSIAKASRARLEKLDTQTKVGRK